METCFVLICAAIILLAFWEIWRYIVQLETIAALKSIHIAELHGARIQRELDKTQIARLEIEIESLKIQLISE